MSLPSLVNELLVLFVLPASADNPLYNSLYF